MYAPARHDEVTGLVHHIDEQLTAIRAAAYGLTEEQARETPCRSALSVGGLIKHAAYCMRGALERLRTDATERPLDAAAYAAFTDSFAVRDDETVAGAIEDFDRLRAELLAAVAASDPARVTTAPPAPWHGIHDVRPVRGGGAGPGAHPGRGGRQRLLPAVPAGPGHPPEWRPRGWCATGPVTGAAVASA